MKAMELNDKAETYFSNNDFENAAKTFQEAIKYNPSEPAFYENTGNSYMKIGDQIKAQKYLKKAIDSFNTKKGKSEYLYGLSKLLSGEDKGSCYYIALSHNEYKYKLAFSVYKDFVIKIMSKISVIKIESTTTLCFPLNKSRSL